MLWLLFLGVKSIFSFCFFLWIYNQLTLGMFKSNKKLYGKVAIVTGGNAGIGFETAKDLANRGAQVILGCRNIDKGTKAVQKIKSSTGNKKVDVMHLDMNSFRSVNKFVQMVKITVPQVDLLVNNAGTPKLPNTEKHLSEDGLDRVLQTNYFSQYLLTIGLKEMLHKSESPRIINVSSWLQRQPKSVEYGLIKIGNVHPDKTVYGISKLMLTSITYELARRFEGIQAYSVHPGFVRTEILGKSNLSNSGWLESIVSVVMTALSYLTGKNALQGAQTTLYCCLADNLINGEYYADCRLAPWYMRHPDTMDQSKASQLWQFTERILL